MTTALATTKTPHHSSNKGHRVAGSMADQIDRLDVGHSVAIAERAAVNATDAAHVLDALRRMRSGQGAYVARITDELDTRTFKVESGTYLTDDKTGIIVSVVVTRME